MDDPLVIIPRDAVDKVVIPSLVVTELDHHKDNKFKSAKARAAIRQILKVWGDPRVSFCRDWATSGEADDQIIEILRYWNADVVVTNDLALQIRTLEEGGEYENCSIELPGIIEGELESSEIDALFQKGQCNIQEGYPANECLLFRSATNPSQSALALSNGDTTCRRVKPVKFWDVEPKGMKQSFLADMLLDPNIQLITAMGVAGSGKTYLALAAALDQVIGKKRFKNLVITRPIVEVGRGLGYPKGTMEEKLDPYYGAIDAILKDLIGHDSPQISRRIQRLPLPYVRGFTQKNAIWIIDEAQDFNHNELKTLLTRVGDKTKVIITGDMSQSDRDGASHGIVDVIRAYRGESFYGHISLDRVHRGPICRVATERM
jgi:PhoH-like ATPase